MKKIMEKKIKINNINFDGIYYKLNFFLIV